MDLVEKERAEACRYLEAAFLSRARHAGVPANRHLGTRVGVATLGHDPYDRYLCRDYDRVSHVSLFHPNAFADHSTPASASFSRGHLSATKIPYFGHLVVKVLSYRFTFCWLHNGLSR